MGSVEHVIEQLKKLDPKKSLMCQVVDQVGNAWNMCYEFVDLPGSNMVVLCVTHDDLVELPKIDFGGGKKHPP